ncbi:MAG: hypothetical protein DRP51_06695 [Candidatus Zixiibacteriota bacterium]|nr:MAG: hypothetical protein DRP51_06695 [candidate division Zixibacteria bacterium]
MNKGNTTISILALAVSLVTMILLLYMLFGQNGSSSGNDYSTLKSLAGELADNNLYQAAIDEYKTVLDNPGLENETRANINYMIGRIYFDNLADYENAAACYIRARRLNPEGSFYDEAGRKLIACLEKMGRILDAKRELDKTVNIDSIYTEHEGETVIAKIGDKPVFMSDIEENIQNLPPQMQEKFLSRESKLEALNGYIGVELIYRAAVREGYISNPEIVKLSERITKQAVVDSYLQEKVMKNVTIDDNDLHNYYLANKDDKYNGKEFEDVNEQVYRDYQAEKTRQAFQDYVNKLAAVENVQIFEEKIN